MVSKKFLAEQIYLTLNGGSLSQDNNIQLADILAWIPQGFATSVRRTFFEDRSLQRAEASASMYRGLGLDATLLTSQEVTPADVNGVFVADLPYAPLAVPGNHAINAVYASANFVDQWVPVQNNKYAAGDPTLAAAMKACWFSNGKIYFSRVDSPICPITISAVVDITDYDDDAQLNIPPNIQDQIIEMGIQKFIPQPADKLNDNNATNDITR